MDDSPTTYSAKITLAQAGMRLDKALAELLPAHSRAAIQQWLKRDLVRLNGNPAKQTCRLAGGESVEVAIPPPAPALDEQHAPAQDLSLAVVHEDADIIVLNKPAGMVTHPGAGNAERTLMNGLLHFDPDLRRLPRAGIVHRLDKDTSGLLVVARTETARQHLTEQLRDRSDRRMVRQYLAVASGVMVAGERINQPIARHRHDRLRMCVTASGKPAVTEVRVARKYRHHCLLRVELKTGRTHQIRVHLSWRGFPLVGDKLYTGARIPSGVAGELAAALQQFPRQALHATALSLRHPQSGEPRSWQQPPPEDLQTLLAQLEQDHRRGD